MKYKVGDKVKVRQWENLKSQYETDEYGDICHGAMFIQEMKEYCGKEFVIEQVWNDRYSCHGISYLWQDWMFEDVETKTIRIEEQTMFGFPIKHLVLIAHWLRKNDITPEILKSSIESMKYGYDRANQEMEESFKRTFETMKKEGN